MTDSPSAMVRAICQLEDGMIIPPTHLELIVADHCNIKCRTCNHASPLLSPWFADPETVHRDFSLVARYYRPRFIKVLGGEPLMHKQLADVIWAARTTGISEHFTLVTNGLLLDRATKAVWESIDDVELSIYPETPRHEEIVRQAETLARRYDKLLTVYRYDEFRATFSLRGTEDESLIARVYAACKIANLWGCHAIRDGYFYKCPQSIYIPKLTGKHDSNDAIRLVDAPDFQSRLLSFLNSPKPLSTCAHCVGTVGKHERHVLASRDECRTHIDQPVEDLVDPHLLARSLIAMAPADDCKIRVDSAKPGGAWQRLQRFLKAR